MSGKNHRVNAEILRVLLDHERSCYQAATVPGVRYRGPGEWEEEAVPEDAKARWEEAHGWLAKAIGLYLDDDEVGR